MGIEHVRPEGVDGETDRKTVPVNPLTLVKVIVEVPVEPGDSWVELTGPADIVKSVTV